MSFNVADVPSPPFQRGGNHVTIFHPGHERMLLRFSKLSVEHNTVPAVHHGTVRQACIIVANNEPGFLSSSNNRDDTAASLATLDFDAALTGDKYYFHLDASTSLADTNFYPICTSFAAWKPPKQPPLEWTNREEEDDDQFYLHSEVLRTMGEGWTTVSASVRHDDKACCITKWVESPSAAHIIPKSEARWFHHHLPAAGGPRELEGSKINDPANAITMRADIHGIFDKLHFAIVPTSGSFVSYFLRIIASQAAFLYHSRRITLPWRVSRNFLYIRFAFTILGSVDPDSFPSHITQVAVPVELQPPPNPNKRPKKDKYMQGKTSSDHGTAGGGELQEPHSEDGSTPADSDISSEEEDVIMDEEHDKAFTARYGANFAATLSPVQAEYMRIYPGYSRYKRMSLDWKRSHPQIRDAGHDNPYESNSLHDMDDGISPEDCPVD